MVAPHSGSACDGGSEQARAVAKKLAYLIKKGTYKLHHPLPPERELCCTFGVSRGVLRKSLSILSEDGLVWRHVGMGTFVGGSPMAVPRATNVLSSRVTLSEMIEARLFIEPLVTRLAAERATKRDLEMMKNFHERAAAACDWATWDEWDDLFHRSLAESSGNAVLIGLVDSLLRTKRESKWCIRRASSFDAALATFYSQHHRNILFHMTRRDSRRAELAMYAHITGIATSVGPALSH